MTKLETLTVPVDLGQWLQSRSIGDSGAYFSTIDALYHYWESVISSSTGSFITDNKKELIEVILGTRGYEVREEPTYYALVKGHELMDSSLKYWTYDKHNKNLYLGYFYSSIGERASNFTKLEWIRLGINDSNADFIELDIYPC